jgi:membrane-associated phospholipid phosphatase
MRWPRLRTPEWILTGFFAYVSVISPWFRDRPHLKFQPVIILALVFAAFHLLAFFERGRFAPVLSVIRDWAPLGFTLLAFNEMELFLPRRFDGKLEASWIRWDHVLLIEWHLRDLIQSLGRVIPFYLELCYLFVYGTAASCVLALYRRGLRSEIDRFLTIYIAGTLLAYALFPYFPSRPPRLVFPNLDMPTLTTWVRSLNLYILRKATIHSGVFPSAHVSSAFSAAWGMFLVLPRRKIYGWALVFYAVSVSVATVYGRYHYAADVLAGFGVSLAAAALYLFLRRRRSHTKKAGTV